MYVLEERLNDPSVCDMDELRSCVQILTNRGTLNPKSTPIHFTPKYGGPIDLARQFPSKSPVIILIVLLYLLRVALFFYVCCMSSSLPCININGVCLI